MQTSSVFFILQVKRRPDHRNLGLARMHGRTRYILRHFLPNFLRHVCSLQDARGRQDAESAQDTRIADLLAYNEAIFESPSACAPGLVISAWVPPRSSAQDDRCACDGERLFCCASDGGKLQPTSEQTPFAGVVASCTQRIDEPVLWSLNSIIG